MFILINKTEDTKYIPMISAKNKTIMLEDLLLAMALKNLVKVIRRPRIDVTIKIPIKKNEICCDQNRTSNFHPR